MNLPKVVELNILGNSFLYNPRLILGMILREQYGVSEEQLNDMLEWDSCFTSAVIKDLSERNLIFQNKDGDWFYGKAENYNTFIQKRSTGRSEQEIILDDIEASKLEAEDIDDFNNILKSKGYVLHVYDEYGNCLLNPRLMPPGCPREYYFNEFGAKYNYGIIRYEIKHKKDDISLDTALAIVHKFSRTEAAPSGLQVIGPLQPYHYVALYDSLSDIPISNTHASYAYITVQAKEEAYFVRIPVMIPDDKDKIFLKYTFFRELNELGVPLIGVSWYYTNDRKTDEVLIPKAMHEFYEVGI